MLQCPPPRVAVAADKGAVCLSPLLQAKGRCTDGAGRAAARAPPCVRSRCCKRTDGAGRAAARAPPCVRSRYCKRTDERRPCCCQCTAACPSPLLQAKGSGVCFASGRSMLGGAEVLRVGGSQGWGRSSAVKLWGFFAHRMWMWFGICCGQEAVRGQISKRF
jgi:hypothetical protein